MDDEASDRRAVFICEHAAFDKAPILYARRDEPTEPADSGWQVRCDSEADDPKQLKIFAVEEVLRLEPTLEPFIDALAGTVLRRPSCNARWTKSFEPE